MGGLVVLGRPRGRLYLVRDEFLGAALNAGRWSVNDPNGDLSVSSGHLVSGNGTGGAWGTPRIVSTRSFARKAGRSLEVAWHSDAGNTNWWVGFATSATPGTIVGATAGAGVIVTPNAAFNNNGVNVPLFPNSKNTTTNLRQQRIVLLETGALVYLRGAGVTGYTSLSGPWACVWRDSTGTQTPLYAAYSEAGHVDSQVKLDYLRVWDGRVPSPVVEDAFTRANNPSSLGSAESGQAWQVLSGTWGIQSNRALYDNAGGGAGIEEFAVVDAGIADGVIEASLTRSGSGGSVGFALRATDANNLLWVVANGAGMSLNKVEAGVESNLATSASGSLAAGATADYRVVLVGDSIQVYAGVTRVFNVTNSFNQSATKHGLAGEAQDQQWDNFRVWGALAA